LAARGARSSGDADLSSCIHVEDYMNAPRVMEVIYVLILLTVLVSMLIQWRLLDILKRLSALSRLDTKLDLLLKQAGIEYDPYTSLPLDVVDAVKRGNKIGAIKRYRERTGVGLKEAKDVIEEVQRRAGVGI
jgi:Ribosomal protein L7/L12 C-terminal domain